MSGGKNEMTSLERVLTTLGHKEPDRVPLFLLVTMHGASELGMSIREYFSRGEYVAKGQILLRRKYGHDCYYPFFYAAVEVEAFGGEVLYYDDGPPNAGRPFITDLKLIHELEVPEVQETACLAKVLRAISLLKKESPGDAPIIGVVMSPFSLPVMQLGYERYLDLQFTEPGLFSELMRKNEEFCVAWANAQLEAGATAICYFDPVASATQTAPAMYRKSGWLVAKRTIARIKGPTATHLASGCALPIISDIAQTGTAVLGVSALEDLGAVKDACRGTLTVLGNLNGIAMRHWSPEQAEAAVRDAIARAGPGGGFILSDNHGEIPYQVPESVLHSIVRAARKWGKYPIVR